MSTPVPAPRSHPTRRRLATRPSDYLYAYYRDDALLLGIGMTPKELMLQLFAKADDPFSGGRTYYGHPALKRGGVPRIPHNSSATGMQAIPAAGAAMGLQYRETHGLGQEVEGDHPPIVLCSIGDAATTGARCRKRSTWPRCASCPSCSSCRTTNGTSPPTPPIRPETP